MYDTILVPTDGSDHAVRAAEHAAFLADVFDADIHLLHVVEPTASTAGEDKAIEERARSLLADVAAVSSDAPSIESVVSEGDPTDTILEYVDEQHVDLLALGTHGRTGVDRYVAGSITESVVRRADVPVLTAHAADSSDFQAVYDDVLVPTDGSDAATEAVDHAITIADAVDATLHAVNVIDAGGTRASPRYMLPSEMLTELETIAKRATEDVVERAQDQGVEAVSVVQRGSTADELLAYVEDESVDLVAMGTHGRTGIDRYLLGSTTERMMRHSPAPVVAVNAHEASD
jgi:nucleotide-binding universal stress UspA family protein